MGITEITTHKGLKELLNKKWSIIPVTDIELLTKSEADLRSTYNMEGPIEIHQAISDEDIQALEALNIAQESDEAGFEGCILHTKNAINELTESEDEVLIQATHGYYLTAVTEQFTGENL